MDRPSELATSRRWTRAVLWLRAGYCALGVGALGLLQLAFGATPWLLAVGVIAWLVCAPVTIVSAVQCWRGLPAPRPGFWAVRWMLISDSVHLHARLARR